MSPLLGATAARQTRIDTEMTGRDDQQSAHQHQFSSLSSKEVILRAQAGKPIVDNYNIRYLDNLIQSQCHMFPASLRSSSHQITFTNYTRCLMLFTEGKHFSGRVDVAQMANRLAKFEKDVAYRGHEEFVHSQLSDIWELIATLDGAIPLS